LSYLIFILLVSFILSLLNVPSLKRGGIEAGFDPSLKRRKGFFSVQFIFLMLIFILFDLELLFLLRVLFKRGGAISSLIVVFVLLTLLLEWLGGKIKWLV